MSRSFGGSDYLLIDSVPLTAAPLTIACWSKIASASGTVTVASLCNSSAAVSRDCFILRSGQNVTASTADASNISNASKIGVTTGWRHIAAVFTSASSREAFLDASGGGADTTLLTPSGINRIVVAYQRQATNAASYTGLIAELGVWNVALSTSDLTRLASGVLPYDVRPAALVGYWPLHGIGSVEPDHHPRSVASGSYSLAVTGATRGNHPPVDIFSSRLWGHVGVVANPPVITSALTASGTEAIAFTYTATATSDTTVTWSATSLPDGLTIDSGTGVISGFPTESGVFNVSLTATNDAGQDTETLMLSIAGQAAGPSLEWTLPIHPLHWTLR